MEIVALELIRKLQEIDSENDYIVFAKKDKDMNCLSVTDESHDVLILFSHLAKILLSMANIQIFYAITHVH